MNATLLQSQFKIQSKNFEAVVTALQKWAKDSKSDILDAVDATEWLHPDLGDAANKPAVRLIGAFQQFGLDVGFDRVTGGVNRVSQRNFEQPDDEHAPAFGRLAGLVEPGSYFLFHRDDDELVRWRWGTDGRFHVEEGGTVFFGERDSLLVEVRATLQTARQESKDKAFRGRIDQLLKELRNPGASKEGPK